MAQWLGRREKQEDAYAARPVAGGMLAVVCDGMGGHCYGDCASRAAAAAFADAFAEQESALPERLQAALTAANAAVRGVYESQGAFGGTTLLAVFAGRGLLHWISVGDSPLYLWRMGRLIRLNADHSMRAVFERYVCAGGMTLREAQRNGHMLRSALTGSRIPLVDAPRAGYPLLPGDRLILCTDGAEPLLAQGVLSPELRALLSERGGSLAARLVGACRELNEEHADNVTVITLDVAFSTVQ
ncbi:MAG: PP2C family protein-serine/threonine phosphatase [Akkermansia sp.]